MTKKEENRPGACDTRTAAETGAACETASSSVSYDNTAAAGRQIQIKDYLLHGAENAVTRRHLRQLTGISDRDLRRRWLLSSVECGEISNISPPIGGINFGRE